MELLNHSAAIYMDSVTKLLNSGFITFISLIIFPRRPDWPIRVISNFFEILQTPSQRYPIFDLTLLALVSSVYRLQRSIFTAGGD
jgi:hypothetical protein